MEPHPVLGNLHGAIRLCWFADGKSCPQSSWVEPRDSDLRAIQTLGANTIKWSSIGHFCVGDAYKVRGTDLERMTRIFSLLEGARALLIDMTFKVDGDHI